MAGVLDYVTEKKDLLLNGARQMFGRVSEQANAGPPPAETTTEADRITDTQQARQQQMLELREEAYREWGQFKGALGSEPAKNAEQLKVYLASDLDALDRKMTEELKNELGETRYDRLTDEQIFSAYGDGAKTRLVEKYNGETAAHKFVGAYLRVEDVDKVFAEVSIGQTEANPEIAALKIENARMNSAIADFANGRLTPDQAPSDYPSYYAKIHSNEERIVELEGGSVEDLKAEREAVSKVYWMTQKPEMILGNQASVEVDRLEEGTEEARILSLDRDGWSEQNFLSGDVERLSAKQVVERYPDIVSAIEETIAATGVKTVDIRVVESSEFGLTQGETHLTRELVGQDAENRYVPGYGVSENGGTEIVHWGAPVATLGEARQAALLMELTARDGLAGVDEKRGEQFAENVDRAIKEFKQNGQAIKVVNSPEKIYGTAVRDEVEYSTGKQQAEAIVELSSFTKHDQETISGLLQSQYETFRAQGVSITQAWVQAGDFVGGGYVPEFTEIVKRDLPRNKARQGLGIDQFSPENRDSCIELLETQHAALVKAGMPYTEAWGAAQQTVEQTEFYRAVATSPDGMAEDEKLAKTQAVKVQPDAQEIAQQVIERLEWYASQQDHLALVNPEKAMALNLARQIETGLESGNKTVDLSQVYDNPAKAEERHQQAIANIMPLIRQAEASGFTVNRGKAEAQQISHTETFAVSNSYGKGRR